MTEHSTEELRRQHAAAMSHLTKAQDRELDARNMLNARLRQEGEAAFAARGIVRGTKVKGAADSSWSNEVVGIYVGHQISDVFARSVGAYPRVMALKADGTAHARNRARGVNWEKAE